MRRVAICAALFIAVIVFSIPAIYADEIFYSDCSDLSGWIYTSNPSADNVSVMNGWGTQYFIIQSKVIIDNDFHIPQSYNGYFYHDGNISTVGYENIVFSYDLCTKLTDYSDNFSVTGTGGWYYNEIDWVNTDMPFHTETTNLSALSSTADNNSVNMQFLLSVGAYAGEHTSYAYIDNIRLTGTPIAAPEPVSTALFILGGATLAVRRLRRK